MMIQPLRLTASLGLLWALASQRLERLSDRLGLGPLAIRAFLPRALHRTVKQELTALEAMVRRVLFLVAMDSPLPRWTPRGAGQAQPQPEEIQDRQSAPRADPPLFPVPAFRLTEPPAREAAPASAPRASSSPQTPGEPRLVAPEIPAAVLFNRFAALREALAAPEAQVARLRRKLARIRADKARPMPLADLPPKACIGPDVWPVLRELHWTLHDAALSWLPILDSG